MCDIGDKPFREVIDHAMDDFLSARVRALVNESVDAWFKENKGAMEGMVRERLDELCAEHVRTALLQRVARDTVEFRAEVFEGFSKRLRDEAEGVMKGHWNEIKARFIQAIHDGERIESVPFGL